MTDPVQHAKELFLLICEQVEKEAVLADYWNPELAQELRRIKESVEAGSL